MRKVQRWRDECGGSVLTNVGRDTNHGSTGTGPAESQPRTQLELVPHGILVAPNTSSAGLVKHRDQLRSRAVAVDEGAPPADPDAHRLEIVGAHDPDLQGERILLLVRERHAIARRGGYAEAGVRKGQAGYRAGGCNVRHHRCACEQRLDESLTLRGRLVAAVRKRYREGLQPACTESQIDRK